MPNYLIRLETTEGAQRYYLVQSDSDPYVSFSGESSFSGSKERLQPSGGLSCGGSVSQNQTVNISNVIISEFNINTSSGPLYSFLFDSDSVDIDPSRTLITNCDTSEAVPNNPPSEDPSDDTACCQRNSQDIANLKQQLAQLRALLEQEEQNDSNFVEKVFAALKSRKSRFDSLVSSAEVGGVVLSASAATYGAVQMAKVVNVTAEILPFADDLPVLKKIPGEFTAIKQSTAQQFTAIKQTANANAAAVKDVKQALPDLSKIRSTANQALKTANSASAKAAGAASTATNAAGAAAAAGATASKGLAIANKFSAALGAIGGAAGLLSVFGFFKATRPTLNAQESRLDNFNNALSKNLSLITQNRAIAKRAEARAEAANEKAQSAQVVAATAKKEANKALGTAIEAKTTANNAQRTATTALAKANQNAADIAQLEQEDNGVNPSDVRELKRQNNTAIGQNNRLISLIQGLPTNQQDELKIPAELLAVPAALTGIKRDTSTIAKNTTPAAQKANSKAGTCQAFAPSQCGDQALSRNFRPIRQLIEKFSGQFDKLNSALNAGIIQKLDRLTQITLKFQEKTFKKFDETWKFLKMDRVLNIISTAASVHNAAMLSRNLLESLVSTVDGMLAMIGLRDAEGNPFSINEQISGGIRAIINRTIGQEAAQGISERWNRWNRIISSGAAVVMAVRSVQWAIAEGVEIIGDWIAKIGNGLRDHGSVNDRQWPWMKEGIKIKQFSAVERFNEGLESAEDITNQIYATVSAGAEIAETVNGVRASKQQFDQTLSAENSEADNDLTQRNAESEAPDIDPIDLVKIEEVEE